MPKQHVCKQFGMVDYKFEQPLTATEQAYFNHFDTKTWDVLPTVDEAKQTGITSLMNISAYLLYVNKRDPQDARLPQLKSYVRALWQHNGVQLPA